MPVQIPSAPATATSAMPNSTDGPESCVPGAGATSVPQRLPGLQHELDALLRLRCFGELDEVLALEVEQPFLVHGAARIDLAAAEHLGDARRDVVVVRG